MRRKWLLSTAVLAAALTGVAGPTFAQDSPPATASTLTEELSRAEDLWHEGERAAALDALRGVVERRTEAPEIAAKAQVRLIRYLLRSRDPQQAETEIQRIETLFPRDDNARRWGQVYLAEVRLSQGRLDEAQATANALLQEVARQVDGEQFEAWGHIRLAEVELQGHGRQSAKARLEYVVQRFAEQHDTAVNWARVHLAEIATLSQDNDAAIAVADEIRADAETSKADPRQLAWALIWRGRALSQSGLNEEARESLSEALSLGNEHDLELAYKAEFSIAQSYEPDAEQESGASTHANEALNHYTAALNIAQRAKLDESKRDDARLGCARWMMHLGMRERSIAWLRMGIEDPANLSRDDEKVALQLKESMSTEEQAAWHLYLVDPTNNPDPTASFVQTEFQSRPPEPQSITVTRAALRWSELGRFYVDQKRREDARAAFRHAAAAATTFEESAAAQTGLVSIWGGAMTRDEARSLAQQAASNWIEAAKAEPSEGHAHYCIDRAFAVLVANGFPKEAMVVLEGIAADTEIQGRMSVRAHAQIQLAHMYAQSGKAFDAETLLAGIVQQSRSAPGSIHPYHKQLALKYWAYALARQGKLSAANTVIDELELTLPDDDRSGIQSVRDRLEHIARIGQ